MHCMDYLLLCRVMFIVTRMCPLVLRAPRSGAKRTRPAQRRDAHPRPPPFVNEYYTTQPRQVSVNESCSASVKTDLLRRLRRLNQGQRRATRVEAGARCSYGLCLLPLAGPPRGAPVGNRPPTAGRGWGRERARGVPPARGGGGGSTGRGAGSYMFPCGHMFHEFCLGVAREKGGLRVKRGGNRDRTPGGAVCVLCSGRGKAVKR